MTARITRHFVTIGSRQMMYRRSGEGPPVVLLHQSPKSSAEHGILFDLLSPHFTVIAPDTPGFGLSDPLDMSPDDFPPIDVFADAIVEFIHTLGLGKVGLYGIHTGASIATRLARLYPDRLHCLVANGTLVLTEGERSDMMAHYFVPFRPSWDGAHMAWLWARMREQLIFFPWYRKDPAARIPYDLSPERLHKDALDFLSAGDDHRTAYQGAIAYDKTLDMPEIKVPTMYVCAQTDVLMQYAHRFPLLPASSQFVAVPTAPDVFTKTRDIFLDYVPAGGSPSWVESPPRQGQTKSRFVPTTAGYLRVRENEIAGALRRVLILPELGASGASAEPWATELRKTAKLLLPDLPGTGDCDPIGHWSIEEAANAVGGLLIDGEAPFELWAIGDSVSLAVELAARFPSNVSQIVLCEPFIPSEGDSPAIFAPDFGPSYEGAQLTRAWQAARDHALFWPWPQATPSAILRNAPPPDDRISHRHAADLLKAGPRLKEMVESNCAYPLRDKLATLAMPVHVLARPWVARHPPFRERLEALSVPVQAVDLDSPNWLDSVPG